MFNKILIANRGEIAVRIIKTAKKLGIKTVAVCSTADKDALHVKMADEHVCIGDPAPTSSYLNIQAILNAAIEKKVDAIHPGYGFLSENPDFSDKVNEAGMIFIGPSKFASNTMGNKTTARKHVSAASVPVVPGTEGIKSVHGVYEFIEEYGLPIMIKAASGGGGIGMKMVELKEQVEKYLEEAQNRAGQAFGDATVYIEKVVDNPHHIEIQIFADNFGNTIHIFDRECSVQRRHQKVIEESPSPFINIDKVEEMGKSAVEAAKSVEYSNAGTVEFLVDKNKKHYFLEMNTRLQVEHPVTEMTTGLDLVELQLRVAAGEMLALKQEDIKRKGHAIECRIYAEDPLRFFPSPGLLTKYIEPQGENIRVDSGVVEGFTVPMYYDPMLAKLIVWGENRDKAIDRMKFALDNYIIEGIKTNIPFLKDMMNFDDFVKGQYDTKIIEKYLKMKKEEKKRLKELKKKGGK